MELEKVLLALQGAAKPEKPVKKTIIEEVEKAIDTTWAAEEDTKARDAVKDVVLKAIKGVEESPIVIDIEQDELAKVIEEALPKVTPLPDALAAMFENAAEPKEEEIKLIIGAVEEDKIRKTTTTVNEALAEKKVKVSAEDLILAKTILNEEMYNKVIAGDAQALDVMLKVLPEPVRTEEEKAAEKAAAEKAITIPTLVKEEKVLKTPDEVHEERLAEIEAIYNSTKADAIANGKTEAEAEVEAKAMKQAVVEEIAKQVQ